MKRFAASVLVSMILGLGCASAGHAVEILHWARVPLAVPLIVGQERIVFVDRNVRVGVPPGIADHLRVQSAGGAIYLRASDAIAPTRLQLQDVASGALILIDIAAEPPKDGQAPLEPVRIVEDDAAATHYGARSEPAGDASDTSGNPDTPSGSRETPVSVVLTRYAAQNLYAPPRTVEPVPGIGRANLRRGLVLDTLLPTLPVRARVLAAWRLDDEWVTTVQLTNTADRWLDRDPRALQGDFVAATFQHPNLGPAGQSTDTTVLYLVTRGHGLAASLLPAVAPIDPALNLPPAAVAGAATGRAEGGPR
ncbi:TIGR03749 family integrating conjugative element protein [Burkholderia cepacia]|uniref:TIGR03749 family integrating conjugative element protein n=1 Tax=Burkholderia cepacia TaxID=292 RepID=UPI002AB5F014|nr:TIGR03749 family integrating conjugative element protein [Burkholderia cepacia]